MATKTKKVNNTKVLFGVVKREVVNPQKEKEQQFLYESYGNEPTASKPASGFSF